MGGPAYDGLIEAVDEFVREMPDVIVISQRSMGELESEFGALQGLARVESGYAGKILGVSVWIDNRFDHPVILSGT